MGLSVTEKLALIRSYKEQGGTGHYTTLFKHAQGGPIDSSKIRINDARTVRATSGKPINPNVDLVTGNYDKDHIDNIISSANRYGIDPSTLLAMDMQETGLGRDKEGAIGHVKHSYVIDIPSKLDDNKIDDYDVFARAYLQKTKDADRLGIKDEPTRLQTYNGLGKINANTEKSYYGHANKSFYGLPATKSIDLRVNPLYGKQIIDIRDNVLKRNPTVMKRIADVTNPSQIPLSQPTWPPMYKYGGKLK